MIARMSLAPSKPGHGGTVGEELSSPTCRPSSSSWERFAPCQRSAADGRGRGRRRPGPPQSGLRTAAHLTPPIDTDWSVASAGRPRRLWPPAKIEQNEARWLRESRVLRVFWLPLSTRSGSSIPAISCETSPIPMFRARSPIRHRRFRAVDATASTVGRLLRTVRWPRSGSGSPSAAIPVRPAWPSPRHRAFGGGPACARRAAADESELAALR